MPLKMQRLTTGQPEPQEAEVFKRISTAVSVSLAKMAKNIDLHLTRSRKGTFAGLMMRRLENYGPRLGEHDSTSNSFFEFLLHFMIWSSSEDNTKDFVCSMPCRP